MLLHRASPTLFDKFDNNLFEIKRNPVKIMKNSRKLPFLLRTALHNSRFSRMHVNILFFLQRALPTLFSMKVNVGLPRPALITRSTKD